MSQLTNILVVDDHAVVRQGIINVLLSIESVAHCDEAENGNQALIKLNEGHYDMVFLDIQMSGMDGIETARHIKTHYKNTKVIMCSAFKEKGQIIAHQGSTGRSTGEHLHYEVRYKNIPLDPKKFLEAGEILKNQNNL